jgi:hypothetical protein
MEKAGTVRIVRFDVLRACQFNGEFNGDVAQVQSKAPYTNSLKTGTSRGNKATTAVDAKCAILNELEALPPGRH